jgi:hypothetical protein
MGFWDWVELICEAAGFFTEEAVKEVAELTGSSKKEAAKAMKSASAQMQLEHTMEEISQKHS